MNDEQLLESLAKIVWAERKLLALAIAHLLEVQRRKLHEEEAYSSLFDYCVRKLRWSEAAAYKRIQAVYAVRDFPDYLSAIELGKIHISALLILRPHLTEENHRRLLDQATGKTKREVERIAAALAPRPDKPDRIQRLCAVRGTAGASSNAGGLEADSKFEISGEKSAEHAAPDAAKTPLILPPRRPSQTIEFLSSERVHFGFTGSEEMRRKIDRLRELLRHKHPAGKLESIIEELVEFYLRKRDPDLRAERLDRAQARRGARESGRRSRYVPQRVKDEVWVRDGGQCVFVSRAGRRCAQRGGLEYDHIVPWATGGCSEDAANIRLLCRAHNQNASRKIFGPRPQPD